MYISENGAKELICSIGKQMAAKQYVAANDGNITIRVGDNAFIVTPTGINKGELTPDKLLKVDFDGNILEGSYKPTSELFMHLGIYKADNSLQSTCHAHTPYLSVFAVAGIELDFASTLSAVCGPGRVPVSPYFCAGTAELANSVASYVKDYHVVNMANHGPISWGKTPHEAWYRLDEAECICRIATLLRYTFNRERPLSCEQIKYAIGFHNVEINDKAVLSGAEMTDNDRIGIPLSQLPSPSVSLDNETIEKLAEKIAKKLK